MDSTGLGPVMAMQILHFKEHDGVLSNHAPVGQLSTVSWWAQLYNGDSSGHLSSPEVVNGNNVSGGHLGDTKQGRGATTRFPFFSGSRRKSTQNNKLLRFPIHSQIPQNPLNLHAFARSYTKSTSIQTHPESSGDAQKSLVATSPQSECTRFNLGFGQPMVCAKYPYGDQLYGLFSSSGLQVPGRMMLPLNLTTDEGLIYVNAKQYHGILRCPKSRAKFEGENKATRGQKVPYMNVSRHLQSMRRPRGSGGCFLNTKYLNNVEGAAGMKKDGISAISQPTSSLRSEVLQSNSGTSNSQKEVNGRIGITFGVEVASVFTRLDLDHFPINHPQPRQTRSFPGITEKSARSIVMPSKWVVAANNRSNPKF